MNKKIIIIVSVLTLLAIRCVYSLGHKNSVSKIEQLYIEKGKIVSQKPELLKQDLALRVQIDNLNKEILRIDQEIYKAINGTGFIQESGLTPIQQLDQYISGTRTESVSQYQQ